MADFLFTRSGADATPAAALAKHEPASSSSSYSSTTALAEPDSVLHTTGSSGGAPRASASSYMASPAELNAAYGLPSVGQHGGHGSSFAANGVPLPSVPVPAEHHAEAQQLHAQVANYLPHEMRGKATIDPTHLQPPLHPGDLASINGIRVVQGGFIDLHGMFHMAKTGFLIFGGLCSKMFGMCMVGYMAFQSYMAPKQGAPGQQQPGGGFAGAQGACNGVPAQHAGQVYPY